MEIETPEELEDLSLLGYRVERLINATIPSWFIKWYKKDGCNCNARRDLLNNWHLVFREYKEAINEDS